MTCISEVNTGPKEACHRTGECHGSVYGEWPSISSSSVLAITSKQSPLYGITISPYSISGMFLASFDYGKLLGASVKSVLHHPPLNHGLLPGVDAVPLKSKVHWIPTLHEA